MHARLGIAEARLYSGDLTGPRREADDFLQCALTIADPNLRAIGWEMKARSANAENDSAGAREPIRRTGNGLWSEDQRILFTALVRVSNDRALLSLERGRKRSRLP
jgi:hypothetical protein